MKLKLGEPYNSALNDMMSGRDQAVLSYIKSIRSSEAVSFETLMEQKALSFRLALKNNSVLPDISTLDCEAIVSPDLKADVHSVRGMFYMHQASFANAQIEFAKSFDCHMVYGNFDKAFLALFNETLAKSFLSSSDLTDDFEVVYEKAKEHGVRRVQALCTRQISNIYFDNGDFDNAELKARLAVDLFVASEVLSDLHLAYVHWADCLIELGRIRLAKDIIARIPGSVDARVVFPLGYIKAKLETKTLKISDYDNINPYWLARFRQYLSGAKPSENNLSCWKLREKTGFIFDAQGSLKGRIRAQSLEGQLLKILKNSPKSKQTICESLWPEYADISAVEARFFRLVNRVNHKLGEYIVFDGREYSLKQKLEIE